MNKSDHSSLQIQKLKADAVMLYIQTLMLVGILIFDLIAAIFLMFNFGRTGTVIYISCVLAGSLIAFIMAYFILRVGNSR